MSLLEFVEICEGKSIYPAIALENEHVREALKARDDELVRKLISEEF